MLFLRSSSVTGPRPSSSSSLTTPLRVFSTIKMTNDIQQPTLMQMLGIKGASELEQLQRSPQLMRAAFRQRAKLLRPGKVVGDDLKMQKLINAYTFLKNDNNKIQYLSHNQSSIDHRLGILREGHTVFGNHDPEHQSLDHLLMKGEAAGDAATESLGTHRTFSDFTKVYSEQSGVESRSAEDGKELPSAAPPRPGEILKPTPGKDIAFLLKLSFEEAAHGCLKCITYERQKRCLLCRGSGRAGVVHTRCPQCHGRGSTKMQSGTYALNEMCDYCMGHGKVPPRLCSACKGHCIVPSTDTYSVSVPSASTNMTEMWIRNKGHDGLRGGRAGNLIVTLMVSEHRLFHTIGLDLHTVLPVPLSVALLGGYVPVPSLRGSQQLRIQPLAASGDIYTIENEGITDHLKTNKEGSPSKGHLKFHLVVVVPSADRLTGRQRSAMEALQETNESETKSHCINEASPNIGGLNLEPFIEMKARYNNWLPISNATKIE